MKFYYITNVLDQHIFDNETTALLKFFGIYTEMYFVSFFFVNEKKYCNLPFDDKFKMYYCTLCFLNEAYVKNFMKKQSIFNTNFNNSFEDVVYYKKLGYQNLWHFEYKAKFDKKDFFI